MILQSLEKLINKSASVQRVQSIMNFKVSLSIWLSKQTDKVSFVPRCSQEGGGSAPQVPQYFSKIIT
jgi:hypothetical protein